MTYRYRRPVPVLHPAESLPFPANLVRQCSDCDLRQGCTAPVPGKGITPSYVMLLGQNPGSEEDQWGEPFCLEENTLVLMADFSWRHIIDVNTGDEILSCDEFGRHRDKGVSQADNRRWHVSTVTQKAVRTADCLELVTKDNKLVLTPDHKVLIHNAKQTHSSHWLEAGRTMCSPNRSSSLSFVFSPWVVGQDYDTGWLAGFFDGEGCLSVHKATNKSLFASTFRTGFSQKQGELSTYARNVIIGKGFSVHSTEEARCYNGTIMEHVYIKGGTSAQFKFLGTIKPTRLVKKATMSLRSDHTPAIMNTASVITSKRKVGVRRVVDLTTTHGTIIANGFIVHNCGKSGQQLASLLSRCGLNRDSVYITNVIKCLTRNNASPKPSQVKACSKWLNIELGLVQPRIVVAMGAPAIHCMLGNDTDTVEHLHGRPIEKDGRIILPCYHPAAGLHDTSTLRFLTEDFQVLRGLLQGKTVTDYTIKDEYPNPEYKIADTAIKLALVSNLVITAGQVAIDTETINRDTKLWSVQLSTRPGTGWFVPIKDDFKGRMDCTKWGSQVIVHHYLNDIKWLDIPENNFFDSMVASYLLGLPQGLKELATRLCGIHMTNYQEVVRPGQRRLSLQYLTEASKREFPDPPDIEDTKWNNKQGKIVTKLHKPWHISRKIAQILTQATDNSDVDMYARWRSIPDQERLCVEKVLGIMPESSLADIPFEDAVQYATRDADATLRVKLKLEKLLQETGLDYVFWMDTGILPMVHEMMQTGMAVDLDHFRNLSMEYDARMRAKATELANVVGHPFNPSSSPQVAQVVYTELGFKPTKTTATGLISTDDQELKKTGHPVAKGIIEFRRLSKMKGTYSDAMVEWAIPDGEGIPRVHTTLKTTRVETGRLSSADPNLQNIPTRNKESKLIKSGFVAPDGKVLIEADYAQIEMVTLAHLSRCKRLIELFLRGGDPHTEMAATIFGKSLEDAKQEKYRYPVKRLNFGIAYLIGARGLSNQIQEYIADLEMEGSPVEIEPWDERTCEKFIAEWYELNPEVKDFQLEMAAQARRYGYVADLFGRRRFIPEVACPIRSVQEAGLRQAANLPVTASAQGIIKIAMGELWRKLPRTGWRDRVKFLLQIHDSLLTEIDNDDEFLREYLNWTQHIMCGGVKLLVPVKVDFKLGKAWGELKSTEEKK